MTAARCRAIGLRGDCVVVNSCNASQLDRAAAHPRRPAHNLNHMEARTR